MTGIPESYFAAPFLTELETDDGAVPALQGRAAIVTGGGKGIGRGISLRLAEAGARVLIVGHSNMNMAEDTCEAIRAHGGEAICIEADLALPEAPERVVKRALEAFGGIDILVNNAAYQPNRDIDEYTPELFRTVIDIDLISYLRMTMACFPHLKKSGHGRIVNIESVHAKKPSGFDIAYATAKGGVSQLTRETAVACIPYGMTCNAILPGGTKVEFKSQYDPVVANSPAVKKPLPVTRERRYRESFRFGQPSDTANLTVFFCTDLAEHYNGVAVRADGGMMLI